VKFQSQATQAVFEQFELRDADEAKRLKVMEREEFFSKRDEFLLPVGPEVGWFLNSLVVAKNAVRVLEVGTSYGYSTLFLADAARQAGGKVVTLEIAKHKQDFAKDMIGKAGLSQQVDFRLGDAVDLIRAETGQFDFVLLDIWKELYLPCFDAFYAKLSDEAIIAADNMISPDAARPDVRLYRAALKLKQDMQTVLMPIGNGIELSCKWSKGSPKL
jgi:predicted O-methyltransferase YrrM